VLYKLSYYIAAHQSTRELCCNSFLTRQTPDFGVHVDFD